MEVLNPNAAILCNYEVLKIVEDIRSRKGKHQKQLATIAYETMKYLEESPCKLQTPEKIDKFLEQLKNFKLTKAEKLMLLNNPPTSPVEIQLMIDESEERLSEDEVENLLKIVVDCDLVPPQESTNDDQDEEEEEDGDGDG